MFNLAEDDECYMHQECGRRLGIHGRYDAESPVDGLCNILFAADFPSALIMDQRRVAPQFAYHAYYTSSKDDLPDKSSFFSHL